MMDLIRVVVLCIILLVTPIVIGLSIKCFLQEVNNTLAGVYVVGITYMLFVFSIVAIVCNRQNSTLLHMGYLYVGALVLTVVLPLLVLHKRYFECVKNSLLRVSIKGKYKVIILIVVLAEILIVLAIQSDASNVTNEVVAYANEMVKNNSLRIGNIDISTGWSYEELEMNQPTTTNVPIYSILNAMLSIMIHISPLIVANIGMPILVCIVSATVYYLLGKELFDTVGKGAAFVCLSQVINILLCYSNMASPAVLIGSSYSPLFMLFNIIIPLLIYYILRIMDEKIKYVKKKNCIIYVCMLAIILAGMCISSRGQILEHSLLIKTIFTNIVQGFKYNYARSEMIVIGVVAYVYIYIRNDKKRVQMCCIWIPAVLLVFVICNPFTYYIGNICGKNLYEIMWNVIPFNIIITYACIQFVSDRLCIRNKIRSIIFLCVILGVFGTCYAGLHDCKIIQNRYKIPDDVIQIADIITIDGSEKKVIVPNELCRNIRLYDSNIKLFYGADNINCIGGENNKLYYYLNQETPNIMPIINEGKTYGICYFVFPIGVLENVDVINKYKIKDIGQSDHYIVYKVIW